MRCRCCRPGDRSRGNGEPEDGDYRELVARAQAWFESGRASIDAFELKADLLEYVERYAIKAEIAKNFARFRGIEQTVRTAIYDAA